MTRPDGGALPEAALRSQPGVNLIIGVYPGYWAITPYKMRSSGDAVSFDIEAVVGSSTRPLTAPWGFTLAIPQGGAIDAQDATVANNADLRSSTCGAVRTGLASGRFDCISVVPRNDASRQLKLVVAYRHPPAGVVSRENGRIALALPRFDVAQAPADSVPLHVRTTEIFGPVGDYVLDAGPPPSIKPAYLFPSGPAGNAAWVWSQTGDNHVASVIVPAAHSPHADSVEHRNEFLSGLLVGLAGAALIAGAQEAAKLYAERAKTRGGSASA